MREKQPSSSSPYLDVSLDSDDTERESDIDLEIERSESDQEEMAGQAQRTLRELANPNVIQQSLCIQFSTTDTTFDTTFELKSGLIHLLPTFRGLPGEDPHKHLKEFHIVCTAMKPQGITEKQILLRAFPFSLADKAKDWLYYLPSGTITTWDNMKQQFLEKFFPASRAANIRKDICGIRQLHEENLYEYWERFKQLCASCPQHQIPEQLLVQYFYEGLSLFDRNMIDAASGGALVNKTPQEARALISNMAANAQQFGTRQDNPPRQVNEVSVTPIDQRLDSLTSLLEKLVAGQVQQVKACGVCAMVGHPTDMCPSLQEKPTQQANAIGGFPGQPQRRYDPYSNSYNTGWRDHPNFSYKNQGGQQEYPQQNWNKQHAPAQAPNSGMSLDEIVQSLAENTQKFQQETRASIQNLSTQVGQLVTSIHKLESQNLGNLSSQTVVNPRENVSAITLRNCKELDVQEIGVQASVKQKEENEINVEDKIINQEDAPKGKFSPLFEYKPIPPFPLALNRKCESIKELNDTLCRGEVNIPSLDAIKQIPRCAKILKELCTTKKRHKLKGCKREKVGEHVSAVIQKTIPIKCSDPGMFSIPCTIDDTRLEKAMLDLGASIHVMPNSVYNYLELGPLTETDIVIQLADRSTVYPRGVIEDVLVKVENLVFPADFYVLDMENDDLNSQILLGRPFLKTSKSVIDVNSGTLTMEFDGEIVKFNIYDTMKYRVSESTINTLDIANHLSQENSKIVDKNELEEIIERPVENSNTLFSLSDLQISKIMQKLPPDRPKHVLIKKGRNIQGIGISKKFKENKHLLKFAMKIFKRNKVDKVTIYEPP
ncbi:uncharacterized protein LOC142541979 [Primulina tabacum]|uniref:uncharacterized protein LOC142541979 n=1 Tax=Primulina tabacum TaxID=48773 RepID=UPI003F5AAE7B